MKFNVFVVCKDEDDCELWHCDQPIAFGLSEEVARCIESRVNNHERLVEMLERVMASNQDFIECEKREDLGRPDIEWSEEIQQEARALLAALEAEKGDERD